jgi:hypothetical protein
MKHYSRRKSHAGVMMDISIISLGYDTMQTHISARTGVLEELSWLHFQLSQVGENGSS